MTTSRRLWWGLGTSTVLLTTLCLAVILRVPGVERVAIALLVVGLALAAATSLAAVRAAAESERVAAESERAAEEQARDRRRQMDFVLSATGVGLWFNEFPLGDLDWDERTQALFFVEPGERPTAELFWSRLHPDDREPTRRAVEAAVRDRSLYEIDHRVVHPRTGEIRWIRSAGRATYDANGTPRRFDGINYDVTARKQAEASLLESEERFRAVFTQTLVGIAETDLTGRFARVNQRYCEIVGRSAEELRGLRMQDVTHPDDLGRNLPLFSESVTRGTPFVIEKRYLRPDGSTVWVSNSVSLVRDERGTPKCIVAASLDITENKRAELALRDSEAHFRSMADNAPTILWVTNAAGVCTYLSRRWAEFTGREIERDLGLGWLEATHPDDRPHAQAVFVDANERRAPFSLDYRLRRSDGEYRWAVDAGLPRFGADGEFLGFVGTVTEVHERKTAEQQVVTTLESITDGFIRYDRDWRIVYVNAEAERINQLRRSEMLGKTPWELFPAVRGTRLETEFLRAMTERKTVEFENNYEPWGRWYVLKCDPTPDGGLTTFVRDVTERKRAEEAVRDAERRKDEFLATLAHELRNPLAPIRNGLQVLKMTDRPEVTEQARTMMERQLSQMVRLVDDLLDVSRITRGKLELRKERVPLEAVLDGAIETSRPLIEQMGHELAISLPDHMVVLDADLTRLSQVFSNLLNNAAKYSDRGGRIELRAEREGSDVVVSVKDAGVGIAPDQLPRLFEMFSQVERSLGKSQGGLGIGLSLVKGLVEMHGGTVEAKSEGPGKGSEFVVRLPLVVEASIAPAHRPSHEPVAPRTSLRVLIVDDNRDAADSLASMMKLMGNVTRTAYDGEDAVTVADEFRPDVILLDIGMPKLNGYDACRRIRENLRDRPAVIIAQTGWGADEDRRKTAAAGFDHHLVKPVDPTALMTLLAELKPS